MQKEYQKFLKGSKATEKPGGAWVTVERRSDYWNGHPNLTKTVPEAQR